MILRAHWINPTRPHEVRTCVEATIEHFLLEAFGSPERAQKAHEDFCHVKSPHMDWSRLFTQAVQTAGRRLKPTEKNVMQVTVSFE